MDPFVDTLIFVGGTGARMTDSSVPKQFLNLGGIPPIAYTLYVFARGAVDAVTVVCPETWINCLEDIATSERYDVSVHVARAIEVQASRDSRIRDLHLPHAGVSVARRRVPSSACSVRTRRLS